MRIPNFSDIKNLFKKKGYLSSAGFETFFTPQKRNGIKSYESWVYASVKARAEETAGIELKLFRNDKEIEEHPALSLLHDVNQMMTFYDLIETTQSYIDLSGDAYWAILKGRISGSPKEIWNLRPDFVEIASSKDNPVAGYKYWNGSEHIPFDPDEIVHFKTFNPTNPLKGLSVVQAASMAIDTDEYAAKWNRNFFYNNAMPDYLLTFKGGISEEEFQKFKENWKSKYKGVENAHKTAMLRMEEGGSVEAKDLSKIQKDIEYLEQRKYSRDEILALFRVPKTILGIVEETNYASAEASRLIFMQRAIKPLMKKLVSTLNEFYLPIFDKSRELEFKFEDPVPEDRERKVKEFEKAVDKWMTINEVRELEGMDPIKGGDDLLRPLTMVPIASTYQETKETKSYKDFEIAGELHNKSLNKIATAFEPKIEDAAKKYFKEQEKRITGSLKSIKANISFNVETENKLLVDITFPIFKELTEVEGEQALELLGEGGFEITPDAEMALRKNTMKFASEVNKTTRDALKKTIAEGMEAGEGIPKITERIQHIYKVADTNRANMIAQTESVRTANQADVTAWKSVGVKKKIWYTALDDRVCDDCMALHGKVISIEGRFFKDDYDTGEQPPRHCRCRCSLLPK